MVLSEIPCNAQGRSQLPSPGEKVSCAYHFGTGNGSRRSWQTLKSKQQRHEPSNGARPHSLSIRGTAETAVDRYDQDTSRRPRLRPKNLWVCAEPHSLCHVASHASCPTNGVCAAAVTQGGSTRMDQVGLEPFRLPPIRCPCLGECLHSLSDCQSADDACCRDWRARTLEGQIPSDLVAATAGTR